MLVSIIRFLGSFSSPTLSLSLSLPPTLSLSPSPGSVSDRPFSPISLIPSERTILPRSRSILTLFEPVPSPLSRPPLPPVPHSSSIQPREYPRRGPLSPLLSALPTVLSGGRGAPAKDFPAMHLKRRLVVGQGGDWGEEKRTNIRIRFVSTPRSGGKKRKRFSHYGYLVSKSRSKITRNHGEPPVRVVFSLPSSAPPNSLHIYILMLREEGHRRRREGGGGGGGRSPIDRGGRGEDRGRAKFKSNFDVGGRRGTPKKGTHRPTDRYRQSRL